MDRPRQVCGTCAHWASRLCSGWGDCSVEDDWRHEDHGCETHWKQRAEPVGEEAEE